MQSSLSWNWKGKAKQQPMHCALFKSSLMEKTHEKGSIDKWRHFHLRRFQNPTSKDN